MTCKECGAKVKRIPTSLNHHLRKHNLNIRSYWLKHLKPASMPIIRNNNQMVNGGAKSFACDLAGCTR